MAASIVQHPVSHSYPPPPTFSQESTESSINGAHLSQGAMQSFDGVQSTPTPTPPASRGHHQISAFNTASYPPPNGVPIQQAPPKSYGDTNGLVPQQQYPPGHKPSIYTAVYSSVSVYEMEVNGVAVMRRRSDSWLNATQILKVAGMEKAKRTKVLEKEILNGEHEKVQGGYGKYQGTWINYHKGVAFCRQYGVGEILRPLLEYDMGQDGITMAGHGNINTPTKEQAMAAQRKGRILNGSFDSRSSPQSQNGTFFSNISKTAAHAVNAINKARFDTNSPRTMGNHRPPTQQGRRPSQQYIGSQESMMDPSSQRTIQSDASFGSTSQLDPALRSQNPSFLEIDGIGDVNEPPRKRQRPLSSHPQANLEAPMIDFASMDGHTHFLSPNQQFATLIHVNGLPALPPPKTQEAINKQMLLLSLFEDSERKDFSAHPAMLRLSGEDLDIPMDQTAHTPLHWAASLGRIELLQALVARGASIYRLNSGGETALMRAATTTNNFQNNTFPQLLKLLGTSIEIRDGRGQTVLHHIATSSAIEGRAHATRDYLDAILLYVVGNSNAPNSQQTSFAADDDINMLIGPRPIGLARFMSDIVNARDMAGDTALHIAAKISNTGIVRQLLEIGADPTISNRRGLKPIDIPGVGDPQSSQVQSSSQPIRDEEVGSKFEEAHDQLLELVQTQLSDAKHNFESERQKKQVQIDAAHASLRENTTQLAIERQRLDEIRMKTNESKTLRLRVVNLRQAHELLKARHGNGPDLKTNIKIGEADAGLEVEASKLPPLPPQLPSFEPPSSDLAQINYVAHLPPTSILQARAEAYRVNNEQLGIQIKALNDQSSELEENLKKVVQVCTRVEDAALLEEMLPRLLQAVESERGEELEAGRLVDLLRRVEGEGA
ncbi:transcriptional regulator swi6 [Xanthoria parietina]